MRIPYQLSILSILIGILANQVYARENQFLAVLPTIEVEASSESGLTKGYIGYDEANISRNNLLIKEIPQTIDVLNIQRNKNYGTNDLSSILEGNAGIDATYDMRGENIFLRGFQADANDIYRDNVRESGQVRRSTANIERVEILKGPASVLYGRSNGGGVINLISKSANFNHLKQLTLSYGSWQTRSLGIDLNEVVNHNLAIRLTGEIGSGNSWRIGIKNRNKMISPSIRWRSDDRKLSWLGQYTYDSSWRVPDRNPSKAEYEKMGISTDRGFARPGDFVSDRLHFWRSELKYQLTDNWSFNWLLAYRIANQDFDHYFNGTFNPDSNTLNQSYAWQETSNQTLSGSLNIHGNFSTGKITHQLISGVDISKENRNPLIGTLRNQGINPYQPETWQHISPRPAATIDNHHHVVTTELFAQDLVQIVPSLKVMIGGRLSHYSFQSTNINQETSGYRGHTFSPNLGVVWDATQNHTFYASYNKSFSPYGGGGYIGVDSKNTADTFNKEPQVSTQWEMGMKNSWINGRLNTTLSAYQIELSNIRYRPDPTDLTRWAIRGKQRSRGIEFSALGQLAPQWYIRSSLGWLAAKIIEDKATPSNEGHYLNNTSNFSGNIFIRYTPNKHFYSEIGLTRLGKRHFYDRSGSYQPLPGFTRLDALIGWKYQAWSATFALSNVLNTRYWRSDSMPGNPRSFTTRLGYEF